MTDPPIDDTQAREQDAPGTNDAKQRAPVHGHTGGVPPDKALSDIEVPRLMPSPPARLASRPTKELKLKTDEYIDEKHTAKQSKGAACGKGEAERGKGLGVWLGPLLAATRAASRSPRLENTRPRASNSADVAIGHRRHAPAGILNRAPMPSPGSHQHPDVRAGARGVAAASTRRHPAHHASNTRPLASSSQKR
eukprot:scaffold8631_cov108-Isochrysis_galbana.AAC.14